MGPYNGRREQTIQVANFWILNRAEIGADMSNFLKNNIPTCQGRLEGGSGNGMGLVSESSVQACGEQRKSHAEVNLKSGGPLGNVLRKVLGNFP